MSCVFASLGKAPCIDFVQPDARCDSSPFRHHVCRKDARTRAAAGTLTFVRLVASFTRLAPKIRRLSLNGEAGYTPFGVRLRTSSAKGSCICPAALAKQPLIQRKNHSPTRIGGHHGSVPGSLEIRSLTYIGTRRRGPSGQPEAVVRPASSSSIR